MERKKALQRATPKCLETGIGKRTNTTIIILGYLSKTEHCNTKKRPLLIYICEAILIVTKRA